MFLEKQIQAQAFKYLREINKLGYIVQARPSHNQGILGIQIYVQGFEKDPAQMDYHIEMFL